MAWAPTSRIRIATALYYNLQQTALVYIDGGMGNVEKSGQQAIDYVETLLDQIDTLDSSIAAGAGDAGLIQADVLKWSDNEGRGKLAGLQAQRSLLANRLAMSLDIRNNDPNNRGGANRGRLIRS